MTFRYDINGLRAIAVMAVMLFHFNPSWIKGGFSGVDVFFVISGYLMTAIIVGKLSARSFNLVQFYTSRANRIIPALSVLCATLFVFGWFYLPPFDLAMLGKHIEKSAFFVSNLRYIAEGGYFDSAAKEKWLLHTWSLSVEWQFYLIYPIFLLALSKLFSVSNIKRIILLLVSVGFLYSVWLTELDSDTAYYILSARAWEMMMGGVAYLYPFSFKKKNKKRIEIIGLSFILLAFVTVSEELSWPGYYALMPVLGSYLVLIANRQDSMFTNNLTCQFLGKCSYSIYLWHWPVVVINQYLDISNWWLYGIPLSILFGYISYRWIESLSFSSFSRWRDIYKIKPVWMAVFLFLFGKEVYLSDGYEWHYPDNVKEMFVEIKELKDNSRWEKCHGGWSSPHPECLLGSGKVGAIVIGDSHAEAMVGMIDRIHTKTAVLDWSIGACATIAGLFSNKEGNGCGNFVEYAIEQAGTKYKGVPVIIINRTSQNLYGRNEDIKPVSRFVGKEYSSRDDEYRQSIAQGMIDTACQFSKTNPTYIVRPVPELVNNVPNTRLRSQLFAGNDKQISISRREYDQRQSLAYDIQNEMRDKCDVKIIDPIPYLCSETSCVGVKNGQSLYFDDDHLSEYGADYIAPVFQKALNL